MGSDEYSLGRAAAAKLHQVDPIAARLSAPDACLRSPPVYPARAAGDAGDRGCDRKALPCPGSQSGEIMPRTSDLAGMQFGSLLVLHREGSKWGKAAWLCSCDCGNQVCLAARALVSGNTRSCGCRTGELRSITRQNGRVRARRVLAAPWPLRSEGPATPRNDSGGPVPLEQTSVRAREWTSCGNGSSDFCASSTCSTPRPATCRPSASGRANADRRPAAPASWLRQRAAAGGGLASLAHHCCSFRSMAAITWK